MKKNIKVKKEYSENEKHYIVSSQSKLLNTFINFFKNAIEAMSSQTDTDKILTIELQLKTENEIIFTIADTGPGISESHKNNIFNFGFTTKKDGFGFGLHTVANDIKLLGGTISFKNKSGDQGCIFQLNMPEKAPNNPVQNEKRNYDDTRSKNG